MRTIYIENWSVGENETVKLEYSDGTIVSVKKTDFDRAFGAIINANKDDVVRDFAIKT